MVLKFITEIAQTWFQTWPSTTWWEPTSPPSAGCERLTTTGLPGRYWLLSGACSCCAWHGIVLISLFLSSDLWVSNVTFWCARACGARIVSRTDELREEDVGTGARLFEVKKIGDEYFAFITDCKDPKACTIILRGASKEILAVSAWAALCQPPSWCESWPADCGLGFQLVWCSS